MWQVEKANQISLNHFLNSFLRDFNSDERVEINSRVRIILIQGIVTIPFKRKSFLGSHQFEYEIKLNDSQIDLFSLATLISKNFSQDEDEHSNDFARDVENSKRNIEQILTNNENIQRINRDYLSSEQSLYFGHPFHPYPKLKKGMSNSEQEKYAPEFKTKFNLIWLKVPKKRFYSNIKTSQYQKEIKNLISFDLAQGHDQILVPMHPWQWDKIKDHYTDVEVYSQGTHHFSPLSSMRTLYHRDSPFQIKHSLSVTLTNSMRHLQEREVRRGAELSAIIENENYNLKKYKIALQYERFFVGLINDDGVVDEASFVQFRENNIRTKSENERHMLLSSLCERGFDHLSKAKKIEWFESLLSNVIKPFLDLYSDYGVLLGAHLQNIIVEMNTGLPQSVVFRDCQGTGFSLTAYEKLKDKYDFLSKDNGNILDENETNKVFGYYLIVNTVFLTISSLAKSDEYYEMQYLIRFRNFLIRLSDKYDHEQRDAGFIHYLLQSPVLYQKGNMRCCLNKINENTTLDPWQIYNTIKNPLLELRAVNFRESNSLYQATTKGKKEISLRPIEESDLDLFHHWHQKEFISEFWELNKSKVELHKYIMNVKKSPFQLPMILEIDNEPAGYFEAYWAFEDRIAPYCEPDIFDRGIHLLFGEEKFLRKGIILESIYHVTKFLLEDDPRTKRVWGEPRIDNQKILKIAQKLPGWKHIGAIDFPHKRAMLLECDKKRFYEDNYEL